MGKWAVVLGFWLKTKKRCVVQVKYVKSKGHKTNDTQKEMSETTLLYGISVVWSQISCPENWHNCLRLTFSKFHSGRNKLKIVNEGFRRNYKYKCLIWYNLLNPKSAAETTGLALPGECDPLDAFPSGRLCKCGQFETRLKLVQKHLSLRGPCSASHCVLADAGATFSLRGPTTAWPPKHR